MIFIVCKFLFKDLQNLISDSILSKDEFKTSIKGYKKKETRISSVGQYEVIGLIECIIDCPFAFSTVRCTSKEALVYSFSKQDIINRISISPYILTAVKQKLVLLSERIQTAYGLLKDIKNEDLDSIMPLKSIKKEGLTIHKNDSDINKSPIYNK